MRKLLVAVVATSALLMTQVLPANAATYQWMNQKVNPNGTEYVDSTVKPASTQFSRTGIEAELAGSGYTWKTKVTFGMYSAAGSNRQAIAGPRSFLKTKAAYTFLPGTGPNDRVQVYAKLEGAILTGTSLMGEGAEPGSTPETSLSELPQSELSVTNLEKGVVPDIQTKFEGERNGYRVWSGVGNDRSQYLIVSHGEYVGYTQAPDSIFKEEGLAMTFGQDGDSLQVFRSDLPLGGSGITDHIELPTGRADLLSETVAVRKSGESITTTVRNDQGDQILVHFTE